MDIIKHYKIKAFPYRFSPPFPLNMKDTAMPPEKSPPGKSASPKSAGRMGSNPHDPLTTINLNGVDHG